jgi:hypothetical protein
MSQMGREKGKQQERGRRKRLSSGRGNKTM